MKYLFLFLLIISTLTACKIGDDDGTTSQVFDFQINMNVLNPKTEYQVGDTLWMEINIPDKTLTDRKSGKPVQLASALFSVKLTPLNFFDSEDSTLLFHDRFQYITTRAYEQLNVDYPAEASFNFGCPDAEYKLKIGVRFKDKGHFAFLLNRPFGTIEQLNPRSQVLISEAGQCNSVPSTSGSFGLAEYVFSTPDDNRAAFEAFMQARIDDPSNWDPESTKQTLEELKGVFNNKAAYFAVVK